MDGASKFVRGDAIAGILIVFINIIGGLVIGTLDHGLGVAEAGRVYTLAHDRRRLSRANSVAAVIDGSRDHRDPDVARLRARREVVKQLFRQPRSLTIAGAVLAILGLLPGMPNAIFLTLAVITMAAGYYAQKRASAAAVQPKAPESGAATRRRARAELGGRERSRPDRPRGRLPVDPARRPQSVGTAARPHQGRAPQALRGSRLLDPGRAHSRQLGAQAERLSDLGARRSGRRGRDPARARPRDQSGRYHAQLVGLKTKDPAFGLDAHWIEPAAKEHAQTLGFTVVDASTVVATHLSELLKRHAHQLLGHEEAQQLLDRLAKSAPKLVENLVPNALSLGVVVKVMQELLIDRVPVRNVRTIAETLAEHAARTQDPTALLAHVREALGGSIVQSIYGLREELQP